MKIKMENYKKDIYTQSYDYPISMNSIRKNIVNWYDFKENSKILEIGANFGEITSYLCDIAEKVTTIEFSREKGKKIELNNKDKKNLEVIVGDYLEEIQLKYKYDYIILIGTLEYADSIMKDKQDPYYKLLEYCKKNLKSNGTILLAVDNRIGVRYLSGAKSYHCEKIYDSVKNIFSNGRLFNKKELEEILEKIKIKNRRYYYPLPDYKVPNIIMTEDYLLSEIDSKINYNFIYEEGSLVVQDEIKLLKQFIENGEFQEYTNSYFVELTNSEINKNIKYVSFNNIRKDEYSLVLKMGDSKVEKYPKEDKSVQHIKTIIENTKKLKELGFNVAEEIESNEYVKSKYINSMPLDQYIIKLLKNNQIQSVYDIIDKWYSFVKEKLNPTNEGIVEYGFIDLVFENFFYDEQNDEFIVFDQEWLEKNIEIKYILYRAIQNICEHNQNIEKLLDKEQIYKKYKITKIEEYSKTENCFQNKVIDYEKKNFYGEQYKYKISSEELIKIISDVKKLDKDNIELIKEISRLTAKPKRNTIFSKIRLRLEGK